MARGFRGRPLTRGRGSKLVYLGREACTITVARSHAGVDRNNLSNKGTYLETRRPLTRGRGSKHQMTGLPIDFQLSPAHTRAWIETRQAGHRRRPHRWSPAHTRAWIETRNLRRRVVDCLVARSHAGVDRNKTRCLVKAVLADVARSHAGVDRNCAEITSVAPVSCRPLTRGRGSKQASRHSRQVSRLSPAHTRAWIETRKTRPTA